ncbi:hypothetical protein FSP39_025524 [Pinctada imbricata]|uniref:Uncharacterized protein n=1 Tax=Pinctada imbricata TaxID=66713 RepID=A0AA88YGH0_PINIB|nr:hypothetical protein FSP39_025524 [Pinctada imbricata]
MNHLLVYTTYAAPLSLFSVAVEDMETSAILVADILFSRMFEEDSNLGLRDIILKVIQLLKENKKVIVDDDNGEKSKRMSFIKLIKKKVPGKTIANLVFSPSFGLEQVVWSREYSRVNAWYTDRMCLPHTDASISNWFDGRDNKHLSYHVYDEPSECEGVTVVTVGQPLIAVSQYQFEVPALLFEWDGLLTGKSTDRRLHPSVTDICKQWSSVNPCGRIIVCRWGCKVEDNENETKGNLTDVVREMCEMLTENCVYMCHVESPSQAGKYSKPPETAILAHIQKLHCLHLHSQVSRILQNPALVEYICMHKNELIYFNNSYQELYRQNAAQLGERSNLLSHSTSQIAKQGQVTPGGSGSHETSREIPKWMLNRHTEYIMTENELKEVAMEILKQSGRDDLLKRIRSEDSSNTRLHAEKRNMAKIDSDEDESDLGLDIPPIGSDSDSLLPVPRSDNLSPVVCKAVARDRSPDRTSTCILDDLTKTSPARRPSPRKRPLRCTQSEMSREEDVQGNSDIEDRLPRITIDISGDSDETVPKEVPRQTKKALNTKVKGETVHSTLPPSKSSAETSKKSKTRKKPDLSILDEIFS